MMHSTKFHFLYVIVVIAFPGCHFLHDLTCKQPIVKIILLVNQLIAAYTAIGGHNDPCRPITSSLS